MSDDKIVYWATPDVILYQILNNEFNITIEYKSDILKLQSFELLYVGISKKNDSFKRLFGDGHKAKLKILTNENCKGENSRLTDELVILMFKHNWFNVSTNCHYIDDEIAVVADVEKAFIKIFTPKYNKLKYKNYPKGKDGLYDKGLTKYGYSINYDLRLSNENASITGKYNNFDRDTIVICNDNIKIEKQPFLPGNFYL